MGSLSFLVLGTFLETKVPGYECSSADGTLKEGGHVLVIQLTASQASILKHYKGKQSVSDYPKQPYHQ